MEITGKVLQLLPLQKGQGKNGEWKKQDFILETEGQYPKKVCISVWGDKVDQFALQQGEKVSVSVEVESREFNGRWYTDVKAWKMAKGSNGGQSAPAPSVAYDAPAETTFYSEESDDLPF